VHAIVAVDSEACLVDIEAAWRREDARALAPRTSSASRALVRLSNTLLIASGTVDKRNGVHVLRRRGTATRRYDVAKGKTRV
jgi:hypothetical protein